jgi:eukaryotic-like serine/threonine-protein kinase
LRQPIPFGKYYLLERINVGGMAEVFKAKATGVEGFERLVAVKRILPSIAEDEEFITMFLDEAKIAVQLTHANIAQIFDLDRVEGSYFIALEYVHGKDMRAIFNRTRQRGELLPIPMTCYAIMKLCEGLDYAHNKHDGTGTFLNLVHRDVSPQNILISYEGEVKIIDFGIAKAVGKSGRTQAGILKGKFGYMSPEQVLGMEIDRRSDIFGVGICLYELLTGERLFVAESDFATLEKVRSVDIMPPSTYNRRIPEELEQIVMRALARDRDRRYQSAMQLHDDLQAFMHTSANMFSRKELSGFMHRMFAEEIDKESARDQEYANMDPRSSDYEDSGLAAFDQIDPVSTVSALSSPPGYGKAAVAPAAHSRKHTLLGMPQVAVRPAEAPRAPSVPRIVPSAQSVPPSMPRPKRAPSRPPAGQGAAAPPGMEWDEEELSTQIYDKPDDDELPPLPSRPALPARPGLASRPPSASRPKSRPPSASQPPSRLPPVSRPPTSAPRLQRPRSFPPADGPSAGGPISSQPFVASPFAGAPPAVGLRDEPLPWDAKPKGGRPMFVAVVAVVAIVASIVLGLMLFGQREPGTVHLITVPGRVAVVVDGNPLGMSTSPFVIGELSAGKRHSIEVSSTGFRPWSSVVELQPGQVLALPEVRLTAIETGFTLASQPNGATVAIDDRKLAQLTPLRVVDLAPGDHRIRVELEGYAPWESGLHATSGMVLPLQAVILQPLAAAQAAQSAHTSAYSQAWRRSHPLPDPDTADDDTSEPAAAAKPPPEPEPTAEPAPEKKPSPPDEPADDTASAASAEATSPTTENGTLRVNTRPWSQVFIDGKSFGNTPRMNLSVPAGTHTVTLVNEAFGIRKTVEVTIAPGKVETMILNLAE